MDTEDGPDGDSTDGQWTLSVQSGILRCKNTRQRLESAIFNAVSLGQWEVAQAFFTSLARDDTAGRDNASELLKLLIMEASNFCSVSASIPTPHHLSWLALQAYNSLFPDTKEQLPDYVRKLIEFRLLLCSIQDNSTTSSVSITSTLCRYHATHVLAIPGTVSERVSPFPSTILSFLHNILVSRPATGHALICSLTVPDSHIHLFNNEALQLLYVEAINETLEAILQLKLPEAVETDSDSQYESDHTWTTVNQGRQSVTKECRRLTNLVYDLLSFMDPQPDMSRVSVDKLFVFILELCHQLGPERPIRFDTSRIYSCLLGRSSPYLLKRLHDAEEYIRIKGSRTTDKKNTVTNAWSLRVLQYASTTGDWRGMFYHTHHDHKHFLECVLDIGLHLIRVGRLNEVSQLLSLPEYAPLRPVLLLLGWDVFIAEGSGKELTEALWPSQISLSQPLLYEGCCRLAFQVELVQWCLDKARPHLLSSSSSSPHPPSSSIHPHTYRAGDMFKGLETHSVLYILHHHTPLAALDPQEVVEILKHRPRVPSLSLTVTPPPQFSRGPTPHKPPPESDLSPGSSVLSTPQRHQLGQLKPEQERDIVIFRSFRALKLVLDALWAAVQISSGIYPAFPDRDETGDGNGRKARQSKVSRDIEKDTDTQSEMRSRAPAARKLEFGEGDTSVDKVTCKETGKETGNEEKEEGNLLGLTPSLQNQVYSKLVLDKLKEAKTCISLLYPLNYRLEILENVFSLLFLTSEDIRPLHQRDDSKPSSAKLPHGSSPLEGSAKLPLSDSEFSYTLSSMALIRSKHGFLINEKVASDLLIVLQDSMFEMRAARFVLTQSANTGGATTLQPDAIRSSISSSSVQQRSAKLEQYINEARWRLQLISSKLGIEAGRNNNDSFKGNWVDFSSSSDSGSEVSESDSELEEKRERERKKKHSQKASDQLEVKPSDTQTNSILVSTRSLSILSKPSYMYSGKVSPNVNPSTSRVSQYSTSLAVSVTKFPRISPSPKLGDRLRQKSPQEFTEGRQSPLTTATSHWSSDHPLCEVDSGEFADVEEKSPQHEKRKKRLRSRSLQAAKKRRRKVSERMDAGSAHGSVISQMLASPSSLLRMCLKHSNYLRASEVLKMFEMEGQFGEAFVFFSEKFESVSRELAEHSRTSTPKHSPSLTPQDPISQQQSTFTTSLNQPGLNQRPSSNLLHPNTHLHMAIANATNSSSALESLHHLLAPSSLQRMLLSGDDQLERSAQDSTTLQVLIEHVSTLVMLDIACSTRVDGHLAKRIIEEASNQCQPILESLTVQTHPGSRRVSFSKKMNLHYDVNLRGPFSLLLLLSEVSGYFTSSSLSPFPLGWSLSLPYHSPHSLLSGFSRQLRTTSIMSYKSFLDSYHSARDRLSKLLECDAVVKDDIVIALMQSSLPLEETQHSLSQALHQNRLNALFEELIHVLVGNQRAPVLPGSPKNRGLMHRSSTVLSPVLSSLEEGGVNTNFVRQFSRYLDQLMDLLLRCLSPTHSNLSEASLLVSILKESPSRLLGRLVFEVGVRPEQLECLMASFSHIHVIEVLVKCCCPPLPSHTPSVTPRAPPVSKAVVALNDGESVSSIGDLCTFSEKLLTKLLSLLKENTASATSHDGTVTSEELLTIYKSPKMKKLVSKTHLLSSVDLQTLKTTAEQVSFYSNVVNFLYAHCIMVCVAGEHGKSGTAAGILRQSMVSLTELQRSPVLQAGVFSQLGYHVGQLGLISCHDLHYSILRRGLSATRIAKSTPLHCRLAPTKPDPWAQFSPTSPDPRVLFVVHPGPASSPLPVPLLPEDLTSLLTAAEKRYLSTRIKVDVAAKEVTVPQWMYNHRDDFGKPVWNDRYSNSSFHYLPDFCLLSYVQSHISREQSELLQPLVAACESAITRKHSLPVKVLQKKDAVEFGYEFSSEGQDHTAGRQSPQTSPKALRRRLSRLRGSQTDIPKVTEPPTQMAVGYSFTSDTLSFVTQQNPLLAALIHLLCPPPSAHQSVVLTSSNRRANKTGSEEESTTGMGTTGELSEGEREEKEREESGRKATLFSLRGRSRTLSRRMSSSYDHLARLTPTSVSLWQRELDDIIVQFVQFEPMQQFLKARLINFNSILTWNPTDLKTKHSSALLEPRDTLRCLALLPSRGHEFGMACSYTFHRLLECGRVLDAVRFLSSEPAACNRRRLRLLSDLALSSAFVESYSEVLALGQGGEMARDSLNSVSPLTLLYQLSDPKMAARLALSSLHNWPVDMCYNILSLCSHHLPLTSPLLPTVQAKLKKISIYVRIMDKCRSLLFTRSGRETKGEQRSWKCWSDLASDSETRPQYVLGILVAEKAFDLARTWAVVHNLGQDMMQQIEVDYLSALLEGSSPDPMSAHRVLDSLVEDKLRLQVCESVLNQHTQDAASGGVTNLETIIFVLHYILSKLDKSIKETKKTYINWLLGAKALLCLPKEERSDYQPLMIDAALLVEQLLINKKIELAAVVMKELRQDRHIETLSIPDMPKEKGTPLLTALPKEETDDPFTPLIVFYANKTLEFPEAVHTSSTPRSFSVSTTAQSTRPSSPDLHSLPHKISSPGERFPFSRTSYTHRRKRSSQTPISPTPIVQSDSAHRYEPPTVPPPKEKWVPDAKATQCPVCNDVYFSMFNRRHHCRRCGRVVCARCSSYVSRVHGYGNRPQRVCKECHSFEESTKQSVNLEDGGYSSDYQSYLSKAFPALSSSPLLQWRLLPNDNPYNDNIRTDFYYDDSPSSALCLTLVDLISSRHLAATYLLDCCHAVSLQLVPDTYGRVNPEVDHYFVIGLIQNLLWSAKLKFEEASDSSGVELCDTYLSRVDLLRQLVSSRSTVIPSIQELTKPELARRVRDRLIQEDKFELAMEVSTKCQLDTTAVWSAWGLACLRCGELPRAREKFKHCFQMSSQRGHGVTAGRWGSGVSVASVQLLERIVDKLEQNPLSVIARNTQHSDDWSSVMVSCMTLEKHSDDCDLDTHRFGECLYYIQSYGSPAAVVTFFVRHNCWTDACKYILDEKCTVEVFVEQLWVPALKAGVIDSVQDILKALNHSLTQWEAYLTAVCRYLSQRSLYHILYQTQLYMRDFIRAGMTCIKFFIGFAGRRTTIRDLYSRLHYLTTAQRHFQSALDAKQRVRERTAGGRGRGYQRTSDDYQVLAASIKNMSVSDLNSHISTIALQMKVTGFMYRCAETAGTLRVPISTSVEGGGATSSGGGARRPPQPITLFSSGHTRAEVAVQLMLTSQDILEGFRLAQEIVTTYCLPPSNVLSEVSRGLAAARRYSDIRVLLDCLKKSSFASDSLNDEVLMAAIKVLASQTRETKQIEKLVQLLTNERSKIKALVQCGKLKNAYLIAIKSRHMQEVRNISKIAEKAGQLAVRDICEKWLQTNTSSRE